MQPVLIVFLEIFRDKIRENNKTMKDLEALHTKCMKKQEVCILAV